MPGERVLWSGTPDYQPFFDAGDWMLIPLAVGWLGFLTLVVVVGTGPSGLVTGLCLLGFGLYLFVGRLVVRFLRLGRTVYTVTDVRVVAVSKLIWCEERTEFLSQLASPVLVPGPSGTGVITFGVYDLMERALVMKRVWRRPRLLRPIVLVGIADAERVCALLDEAIDRATVATGD